MGFTENFAWEEQAEWREGASAQLLRAEELWMWRARAELELLQELTTGFCSDPDGFASRSSKFTFLKNVWD